MGSSSQSDLNTTVCSSNLTTPPSATAADEVSSTKNDTIDTAVGSEGACESSPKSKKRRSEDFHEDSKPKRVNSGPTPATDDGTDQSARRPSEPAELKDNVTKETWQGFCEIESEPAFFSAILHDMGVQDINVREIFSMTPDCLETLPRPIYGLILLYQYHQQGVSAQQEDKSSHVWFANQLPAQNSCATLAMINILMNNAEIEIGEHLRQFKDFTEDFTPYQRGEALASFDFVKKIHNSFAKEMDILEADKHLSHKVKKSQRQQRDKKSRRKSTDSGVTDESAESDEENAHHFIAYIPVGTEVWMLDGLNAQPMKVGTFDAARGGDWVSSAADSILAILASGRDEYTGFALMPSALPSLRKQASLAINHIKSTESQLDSTSPDWCSFITDGDSSSIDPSAIGIEDQLSTHPTPDTITTTITSEGLQDLLNRRMIVLKELNQLTISIVSEMQDEADNATKAAQGRFDHGPVIKLWAEMLAENGYLEQNLDRFIESKGGSKKGKK
jgi:ubiquitin carboxyl-terminal hydrolase L5